MSEKQLPGLASTPAVALGRPQPHAAPGDPSWGCSAAGSGLSASCVGRQAPHPWRHLEAVVAGLGPGSLPGSVARLCVLVGGLALVERVPTSGFRGSCAEKAGGAERAPWGEPVARQQDSARACLQCPGAAGGRRRAQAGGQDARRGCQLRVCGPWQGGCPARGPGRRGGCRGPCRGVRPGRARQPLWSLWTMETKVFVFFCSDYPKIQAEFRRQT